MSADFAHTLGAITPEYAEAAGGEVAAEIVHRLTCNRCRMGWTCGGLGVDDYRAAVKIADLMATHRQAAADAVLAEAHRLASAHHVASNEHGRIVALGERLAAAARGGQ
jgi:hypothetical protein